MDRAVHKNLGRFLVVLVFFGSQVKSPCRRYDSSYNPLDVEWGLRVSTSVQAHRRMIITAEITECPSEPWNGE